MSGQRHVVIETVTAVRGKVQLRWRGRRGGTIQFMNMPPEYVVSHVKQLVSCLVEVDGRRHSRCLEWARDPVLEERVARLEARVTELEQENVKVKRELRCLKTLTIPWMRRQYALVLAVLAEVDVLVKFYSGEYDHRSSLERLYVSGELRLSTESHRIRLGDESVQLIRRLAELGVFKVRAEAQTSLLETLPRPLSIEEERELLRQVES